jgi:pyruvate dehydrogenase E1 component
MRVPSSKGRLTEEQLQHFREEVGGRGLSSYPHPG